MRATASMAHGRPQLALAAAAAAAIAPLLLLALPCSAAAGSSATGAGIDDGGLCLLQTGAARLTVPTGTGNENGGGGNASAALPPKLAGVNFGGWLVLEDWFFSGSTGRYVGSPINLSQGVCLPPFLPHTEEPWSSEGILTRRLVDKLGVRKVLGAFAAHRDAYLQAEDYGEVAGLGIRHIRLPIPWTAFADALAPLSPAHYGAHDPEAQATVVPDPFYPNAASYVTVPRKRLSEVLWRASQHGLKVVFDVHTMPGGSSQGTYNGIWPMWPAFWKGVSKLGNHSEQGGFLKDAGLWICSALIRWVEGLNPQLQQSVLGMTFMNEPAHQAAKQRELGEAFAEESEVWEWLAKSSDLFRRSTLPAKGMRLYVNLIDSAFEDHNSMQSWFTDTFTLAERQQWAVIDIHWYSAWSTGVCDGRTGVGGGYSCDQPLSQIRDVVRDCVSGWANHFANTYDGLKAIAEFSLGTFQDARFACQDPQVLRVFLEEQVAAFNRRDIEPFFWTWRMPYGNSFEAAWSLKRVFGRERGTSENSGCSG